MQGTRVLPLRRTGGLPRRALAAEATFRPTHNAPMAILLPDGIDAEGFILTVPDRPLQPEFRSLVEDVVTTLTGRFASRLDGLYLYGSVAHGHARPGLSDLDLSLVLREPASAADSAGLEDLRCALQARHPEVSKIDFDLGTRAEVLAPCNRLAWGYWLRHECRCLWGEDLSAQFERFRPSRAIALAVNGDFDAALTAYARRIGDADDRAASRRLQREAARRLIRSTGVLRTDKDLDWPRTLEARAALLLRHHPSMAESMRFFLDQAQEPTVPAETFVMRLNDFAAWMVREMAGRQSVDRARTPRSSDARKCTPR